MPAAAIGDQSATALNVSGLEEADASSPSALLLNVSAAAWIHLPPHVERHGDVVF